MDSEMDEGVPQLVAVNHQNIIPTSDDFQKISILYTSVDPHDREIANQLVHFLRGHPRSYQIAVQMYTSYLETSHPQMLEWTKFFCLQIINDYITSNYNLISVEEISYIKTFMNSWLRNEVNNASSSLIKHKMAVLFSTLFLCEYPIAWPTFFEDLLQSCNLGREAVDNFLRTLIYICDEIGERDLPCKDELHKRNTNLKDAMREGNTLQLIINKIQEILVCCCPPAENCACLDTDITKLALEVIEKYVSWIDIDLIANDEMFRSIINVLSYKEVNHRAIDCIHEVIYKGMVPANKFRTTHVILNALLFNDRYCSGPLQCNDEDEEYESRVGRLLNTIGLELIKIMNKIAPETTVDGNCVVTALHKCVEIMINFLACEFDDISITVTEFAKSYVHVLKARSNKIYGGEAVCTDVELYFVKMLLEVVVMKMRYDEDYNFMNDGELEADFQDYRKLLNVIFENITAFNKMMAVEMVEQCVKRTVSLWRTDKSVPFNSIEVACHLFYLLGESLPVEKGFTHFTSPSVGATMTNVMNAILAADLPSHPHHVVCLYFFEIVSRFDKFFRIQHNVILCNVVNAFLSERGLRHPNMKVRSRLAFLFSRFVRTLKDEIRSHSDKILCLMEPLLAGTNSVYTNPLLSHDDQLYVYETICFLVLNLPASNENPNQKAHNLKNLLAPIKHHVELCRSALLGQQDEVKRVALVEEMSHHIAIAGRCSKAFTCRKNMQDEGVVDIFLELMVLFISLVEDLPMERNVLDVAVKQYLHRMVICLEHDMLPATPRIVLAFTKVPNPVMINDFLPLLTQMVNRFKGNLYDYMLTFRGDLFIALGKALGIDSGILEDGSHDENLVRDRMMLRRSYYQLVSSMFNNHLGDIFLIEDMFKFLVKDVLYVITCETDPLLKKNAFYIIRKSMEVWNNENYHDHVFKTFVSPFFTSLNNSCLFDSTESSFSSAGDEAAQLIQFLHKQNASRLEEKLRSETFLGRSEVEVERFILLLQSKCDLKSFRQYLKLFYRLPKNSDVRAV